MDYMVDLKLYSLLAVLHETNGRDLKKKLALLPEDLYYYATAASSIIGAENAKRLQETPAGVIENSEEFVAKLLEVMSIEDSAAFSEVLGTLLIESLKDELKFCCLNCSFFDRCIDIENLTVGELFLRRVNGEETAQLKAEITREVDEALLRTPYVDSPDAHTLCRDFIHQYNASNIAVIIGRYTEIAMSLRSDYGLDYAKFLQSVASINMAFFEDLNSGK
jgi:hypothetical protein